MSNPLEESYSKTITESFLHQAESLLLELSQKKLTSGIYLRDGSGRYLSSHFTGHHINDALKNESDHNLQWPDTDIIIDLETLAALSESLQVKAHGGQYNAFVSIYEATDDISVATSKISE